MFSAATDSKTERSLLSATTTSYPMKHTHTQMHVPNYQHQQWLKYWLEELSFLYPYHCCAKPRSHMMLCLYKNLFSSINVLILKSGSQPWLWSYRRLVQSSLWDPALNTLLCGQIEEPVLKPLINEMQKKKKKKNSFVICAEHVINPQTFN